MGVGETIETVIRELVSYCHQSKTCDWCPFKKETKGCRVNIGILEDLVHYVDTEIVPKKN